MGMNRLDLDGRTAVVTGGSSGLGAAIAERLLRSGARVRVWDRLKPAPADGVRGLDFAAVDVTRWEEVRDAAAAATAELGRIDILVNSAGVAGDNAPTWDYPVAEWTRVLRVNLDGTFHTCKAVAPFMIARGSGRIVNVASIAGKEGNPNAAAYAASKGGVIALTKALGKELAQTGVIANCITPAAIDTPLLEQSTPEFVAYMKSKIPMGRLGRVDEVAAMAAWMCTQECSFTTGAVFDLSGGRATY
jgi:3-oxoacyl-[acyl-carrier protein] reductase